jgi:hypothetical protein
MFLNIDFYNKILISRIFEKFRHSSKFHLENVKCSLKTFISVLKNFYIKFNYYNFNSILNFIYDFKSPGIRFSWKGVVKDITGLINYFEISNDFNSLYSKNNIKNYFKTV